MKILYIITKSNWGGAQRHVFDLATAMKDAGHDVAVALGGDGPLRVKLEASGIYCHSISKLKRDISASDDVGSFKEIYSIIKYRRPDILHLHSPKASGIGALAGRILRVPSIVTTVHGWTWNESRPILQKAAIALSSWVTMLLCHKVILITQKDLDQAKYLPFVKDKLTLISLGMRAPIFVSVDGAKNFIATKAGITDFAKKTILGTIAELHDNKGLSYFVSAMRSVCRERPNTVAVVIGEGERKQALIDLIVKFGLEKNIILLGYIENASEYLKAFNIFVLPSVKEGLPYVLLEAGYASLPVVATSAGGIPEIVEDMKSGILVQPKKSKELAHAISFMIEHSVGRKAYGTTLRERVIALFSMEKMITKTENLYQALGASSTK